MKTYSEDSVYGRKFYAVVELRSGHTYFLGPFPTRYAALGAWKRAVDTMGEELR